MPVYRRLFERWGLYELGPIEGEKKWYSCENYWLKRMSINWWCFTDLSEVSLFTERVFLRWLRTKTAPITEAQSSGARESKKIRKREGKRGKDAPCSSSRVMDPSCLLTTDEGESETKIKCTEKLKQQQSRYKHKSAALNPQETHCSTARIKKTFPQQTQKPQTL